MIQWCSMEAAVASVTAVKKQAENVKSYKS